jgi:hypothetical protein
MTRSDLYAAIAALVTIRERIKHTSQLRRLAKIASLGDSK